MELKGHQSVHQTHETISGDELLFVLQMLHTEYRRL